MVINNYKILPEPIIRRNFAAMKPIKPFVVVFVVLALLAALSSCSSSRHIPRKDWYENYDDYGRPLPDRGKKKPSGPPDRPRQKAGHNAGKVIDLAYSWLGTPYRYAGTSRSGVDCSGLTCRVFEDAVGIKLPRSSRDQADYCRKISQRNLQPGDLVFFVNKPGGNRVNHVGLYIGDGKMIHASSSQGVVISGLDEEYWRKRLYKYGRVRDLD